MHAADSFPTMSNYMDDLARKRERERKTGSRLPIKLDFITIGQVPVCDNAETTQ